MRHRQRHVHASIVKHVAEILADGGWTTPPLNFGISAPVTLLDYEPQEAGQTPALNTVAVSIDNQGEDEAYELGGGLHSCRYTVFIDIYGQTEPHGIAIGDDIKVGLVDEIIPLRDFTIDPDGVETDAQIEFEAIFVEKVPTATTSLDKRSWRVVKATAVTYF